MNVHVNVNIVLQHYDWNNPSVQRLILCVVGLFEILSKADSTFLCVPGPGTY